MVTLISGGGRTVLNLQRKIDEGMLHAKIVRVIGSRRDLVGLARAKNAGLSTACPSPSSFDNQLEELITEARPDLICLCGYLRHLRIRPDWSGRIINIHPSLLPRYGGKGMYGRHVHEAVLAAGDDRTGCTVHYVDDQYDHGPIILQRTCAVRETDTARLPGGPGF